MQIVNSFLPSSSATNKGVSPSLFNSLIWTPPLTNSEMIFADKLFYAHSCFILFPFDAFQVNGATASFTSENIVSLFENTACYKKLGVNGCTFF